MAREHLVKGEAMEAIMGAGNMAREDLVKGGAMEAIMGAGMWHENT